MAITAVVGAQWGDEGKGKLAHILSQQHDFVLRYQGGSNAGHTVKTGGETYKFKLVPSGILCSDTKCILCDGVVVNLITLAEEITELSRRDALKGDLMISSHAHLVLPFHCTQDEYFEDAKGKTAIGTTRRGIGPAYADKYFRVGLRAGDMLRPDFELRVKQLAERKNILFSGYYGQPEIDPQAVWDEVAPTVDVLAPLVCETVRIVRTAADNGCSILCEGAQGTLLDIDYGTYPFVTSSHPVIGGAFLGTGLNWQDLQRVIGISKAYTTRVGAGPFPTEESSDAGAAMAEAGQEYGTVTGRPRRCGWLDLVLLRYAAKLSGFTEIALTKTDVLDNFAEIPVCVAYRRGTEILDWPELDPHELELCEPVYEKLAGWQQDTSAIRSKDRLPVRLLEYVRFIEEYTGVHISMVSVGPSSDAIVQMD